MTPVYRRLLLLLVSASLLFNSSGVSASTLASFDPPAPSTFRVQALATPALSGHLALDAPQKISLASLSQAFEPARRRLWVLHKKTAFHLWSQWVTGLAVMASIGHSENLPSRKAPEFFRHQENAHYRIERKLENGQWVYRLIDKLANTSISVTEQGNDVRSFIAEVNGKKREMISYHDGYKGIGRGGMPILFPFANRVGYMKIETDKGTFILNGEEWVLELKGHAIHGVVSNFPWTIISSNLTKDGVSLTSRVSLDDCFNDLRLREFFGHATLTVTHTLHGNTLESHAEVRNFSDHAMTFSLAFHPYFAMQREDGTFSHVDAEIPGDRMWENDEDSSLPKDQPPIPVPPDRDLQGGKALTQKYDHVYAGIKHEKGWATSFLRNFKELFQIAVSMDESMHHVVIYTDDKSIALEPQSSATNAFHLQKITPEATLVTLAARKTWSTTMKITISSLHMNRWFNPAAQTPHLLRTAA